MPKQKSKTKKSALDFEISFRRVNATQKAVFAKHLSVMLKSGLTVNEAIDIASQSALGRLKKVLRGVLKSVQAGNDLASSFARYPKVFTGAFISATAAGESSGTLDKNLDYLAKQLEKEKELTGKVKGAMFYPLVVLAASFGLGLAMAFLVLPKIVPLFEGLKMELPLSTRVLIWSSHFVQSNSTALFIGIIIFVVFFVWLVRQKFIKPLTHWLFLKIPVVKGISINSNLVRFCRTLGMLLKSGLTINEALEITSETAANYHYKKALRQVSSSIGKGAKLSTNLKRYEKLFPIMAINMIRVGEESGNLEETLLYLASFYETEVDNATKSLSTIIEPALLIMIGLVVGFLAISIITPIYNITSGIKR
mgnify:CR=1 FL=1